MGLIIKLMINAVAIFVTAYLLGTDRVVVEGPLDYLWIALLLGLVNLIIKPILVILTLPITILTLGLFLLVINALMVLLVDYLLDGFEIKGFIWALVFSLVLTLVNYIMDKIFDKKD